MAEISDKDAELNRLRGRLDEINASLVSLLNERALTAQHIGAQKGGAPVYVPSREAAILDAVTSLNEGPLPDTDLRAIFSEIISACRNLQRPVSVAYLGPAGTYTEEAARKHLGSAVSYIPYSSIEEVVHAVEKGSESLGVIPIENTVEGPVGQSLDALRTTSLRINGEVQLPIHHQLLSNAGSLELVKRVIAHPQALAQCRQWLHRYVPHAEKLAASSNAEAARLATTADDTAAIAGSTAARLYQLPILAENIEDEASNTTRFLVIGNDTAGQTGNDRTSIVCSVQNEAGSLYKLLSVFAEHGVSMTKLESRPVRNESWQYVFYIDLDGHCQDERLSKALDQLEPHAAFIKLLGSYPKAR